MLGGFSQGAVMTYALGLGAGRPRPAGLIALSGFMPTVPGFSLDLEPPLPRIAIGHGALDPVISVEWSRDARARSGAAGADLTYRGVARTWRTRSTRRSFASCRRGSPTRSSRRVKLATGAEMRVTGPTATAPSCA